MAKALFRKHLFPDIPLSETDDTVPRLPVLDTITRQFIVEVILVLIKDDTQSYAELMMLATALVPNPSEDEGMFLLDFVFVG